MSDREFMPVIADARFFTELARHSTTDATALVQLAELRVP